MERKVAGLWLGAAGAAGAAYKALNDRGVFSDLQAFRKLMPFMYKLIRYKTKEYTITDMWYETLAKHADRPFLIFENQRMSFSDVEKSSNECAHYLLSIGVMPGDVVSLDIENHPCFVIWWLGITKIGAKAAFFNNTTKGKQLAHSVKVSNSKFVICHAETEVEIGIAKELMSCQTIFYGSKPSQSNHDLVVSVDDLLHFPNTPVDAKLRQGITMSDIFGFIYTSGTTGMPKAANITHYKMAGFGAAFSALTDMKPTDSVYVCLPIYHSAGGGIGIMSSFFSGASVVISRKFSNRKFWAEVSRHQCTHIMYIGELARYLVKYAEEHPEVKNYPQPRLRWAIGNGLRPEVWDAFQDGFQIPNIFEFYGSTEGTGALMNQVQINNIRSRGAVGKQGALAELIYKFKIVKFDLEAEVPVRDNEGRCIECGVGETGELLMPQIWYSQLSQFVGYTDPEATKKKILTDVFVKGDSYFRTGDLLRKDSDGYYYFVDRIGDTFRWKGENVSTTEVAEIVSTYKGIIDANIFGVQVPGEADGRACMAALTLEADFSITDAWLLGLSEHCKASLPKYALPLFLRILPESKSTVTFKQEKVALRAQGCDPTKCTDELYWLSPEANTYMKFDATQHQALAQGQSKL